MNYDMHHKYEYIKFLACIGSTFPIHFFLQISNSHRKILLGKYLKSIPSCPFTMLSYCFNPAHNNVLGEREESFVVQIYFFHDCRLRLGFSHLKHKFKHNFQDLVDPLCSVGIEIESTKHFLLHCANFSIQRKEKHFLTNELN